MAKNDRFGDIVHPPGAAFILVHLSCLAVFWSGATVQVLALCVALYFIRIFAIGAGYHRYFAHRSFRTSRAFQFLLAFLAQTSAQGGVLWWAAHHRRHHRYSDSEHDVHSPITDGAFHAHVGWIFAPRNDAVRPEAIHDLSRYPELRWLERHHHFPSILLGFIVWLTGGWPALIVGFCWSTVAVWHATFSINSLAHLFGKRRYVTGDESRNNWFLALLTMGEGWHNNHHACQVSVRQGFRWWEWDPTFYLLKALSYAGLVWDLHAPPPALVKGQQRPGRRVIEMAAAQLAASFPINAIASQVLAALVQRPGWIDLRTRVLSARLQAEAFWSEIDRPPLPTLEEVLICARTRMAENPSVGEIAVCARERLLELVYARLVAQTSC